MATGDVTVKLSADTSQFHKDIDVVERRLKALKSNIQNTGLVNGLFNFFNGRCTFFAILFTGVGITLSFQGKLTAEYVALVGAIQALLVAHSVKEDMNDLRQAQINTTVVNNNTVIQDK